MIRVGNTVCLILNIHKLAFVQLQRLVTLDTSLSCLFWQLGNTVPLTVKDNSIPIVSFESVLRRKGRVARVQLVK